MGHDDARPTRIQGLTGTVTRRLTAAGSKSERLAFWLDTDEGCWRLRRKDGPTFGDAELEQFIDRRVSCDGYRVGDLVLTEHIELLMNGDRPGGRRNSHSR